MIEMHNNQMDEARRQTLAEAVCTYGQDAQLKIAIEEMSELTKAICKFFRAGNDPAQRRVTRVNIIEEAADVQIMLDQIRIMFGSTAAVEEQKLERLRERLGTRKAHVYVNKSAAAACAEAVSRAMSRPDGPEDLDQRRERAVNAVNNLFTVLEEFKEKMSGPQ